jgi:hypothetical protein
VARLPPSFVAVAAGPVGNTSWWRFERGNDDDDVLAVKSVTSALVGWGVHLAAGSCRAGRRVFADGRFFALGVDGELSSWWWWLLVSTVVGSGMGSHPGSGGCPDQVARWLAAMARSGLSTW